MSDRGRILIIEDDLTTSNFLATKLEQAGYRVETVADGEQGLERARRGVHTAIIIDRMLPGMDGLNILAEIRSQGSMVPAIVLSALGSTGERVKGLRGGADDYLVKPFSISELLARLEALLRRQIAGAQSSNRLSYGDLSLDMRAQQAQRAGEAIALKPREARLLEFLQRNMGNTVTRSMILEEVWQYDFDPGTNVIDVHISNLRRKIDRPGLEPLLHTVRGVGYCLGDPA